MIIAVDGPAASGKGTLARRLASHFELAHLDTGQLYRAVAARVRDLGLDGTDPRQALRAMETGHLDLERGDLRDEAVGQVASVLAGHPEVRAGLLDYQRNFARFPPDPAVGAVLDGRDIGTVVLPDADIKFFVTATRDVRLERRFRELRARNAVCIRDEVAQDMKMRDDRDRTRGVTWRMKISRSTGILTGEKNS